MKSKFDLPIWPDGYCDIFVCGQKVTNAFDSSRNNIALKVPDWVTPDMVKKVPHDPRVELAPRGVDDYFELDRSMIQAVNQGLALGQSVDVEVVRNVKDREDVGDQVQAIGEDGGLDRSDQDRNRRNKDNRSRRRRP